MNSNKSLVIVFLKILLYPISFIYGCIISVRNLLYNVGILSSKKFKIPLISVGNISVGGTGKTPQIEYLIRLLKEKYQIGTLSRGYGRDTSGFLYVTKDSLSTEVGDEPRQFKLKFPDVTVAVDKSRVHGIKKMQVDQPELNVILLDDAFQHRAVKSGLSILLTDFGKLYFNDQLLPVGTLREFTSGVLRADIVIVTKCPDALTPIEKRCITSDLKLLPYQHVYFSTIKYAAPIPLFANSNIAITTDTHILLLTGIANALPLVNFISEKTNHILHFEYRDHHEYTVVEMEELKRKFESIATADKIIITTEKDAMRLNKIGLLEIIKPLPFFYIPIETSFLFDETDGFNKQILDYVK